MLAVEVEGAIGDAAGIALCLHQNILRAETDLLGLDNAQQLPGGNQSIVGRAIVGGVFGEGVVCVAAQGLGGVKGGDLPALGLQHRVDALPARPIFGFILGVAHRLLPCKKARGTNSRRGSDCDGGLAPRP